MTRKKAKTDMLEKHLWAAADQFLANSGLILDPACGSGGMFVQSARSVAKHK